MSNARIRIDIPDLGQHTHRNLKDELEVFLAGICVKDATVTVGALASETQLDEAREVDLVRDGELEIDDVAEISAGKDNGYYISAWLWVEGGGLLVTAERIQELYKEHGLMVPEHLDDLEVLPDEYVASAMKYLEEQYGKDAHIGTDDLTAYLEEYADTLENA